MVIWALFDSGNGCYKQVGDTIDEIEIYSVGLDVENKNSHFLNQNLADYSRLFGSKDLWNSLDTLPKPDLIIASPPCESWSVASAMYEGNACWKREQLTDWEESRKEISPFTIRDIDDYDGYQYNPLTQVIKRVNGELCTLNLTEIIRRYKPKYWVIENPELSKIWEYLPRVLGFELPFENKVRYSNYGYEIDKPTRFSSNVWLNLDYARRVKTEKNFKDIRGYNERSNIPLELVREIFTQILDKWEKGEAGVALQPLEFGKMGGRKTPKQRALEKLKNNNQSEE
jgi:hypothetical protein